MFSGTSRYSYLVQLLVFVSCVESKHGSHVHFVHKICTQPLDKRMESGPSF